MFHRYVTANSIFNHLKYIFDLDNLTSWQPFLFPINGSKICWFNGDPE